MTWEMRLIFTYFTVCNYRSELSTHSMRYSNNSNPAFTDEEIMTIYLFSTTDELKLHTNKQVYIYADRHLRTWFPQLPNYEAFNGRLNNLSSCFKLLAEQLSPLIYQEKPAFQAETLELIVDSLPIMLAKNQRARVAKVAPEIANLGYCATKSIWYFGLKVHAASLMAADKKLPSLYCCALTAASEHDNTAFKDNIAPNCENCKVYADSAYCDKATAPELFELYGVTVCPIEKRKKGQKALFYDQTCQNTAISRVRQPIEGYFNWLIEHTDIQNASKCRSLKGVLTHIYAKIAASLMFLLIFNS
ncbi:MAG: transposase [Saprospiraceae bacterium]|nr:transposase [Saprospiraceae bacterium]MDZ7877749.1 transposase [Saprospiraceae bacterium]